MTLPTYIACMTLQLVSMCNVHASSVYTTHIKLMHGMLHMGTIAMSMSIIRLYYKTCPGSVLCSPSAAHTHTPLAHTLHMAAALPPYSLHNITCISQYSSRGVFSLSASLVLQQALLIRNFRTALCSSVHHTSKQHCDPSISSILFACVCV